MNIQHTRRQNGKSNQHDVRIPVLLVPSEIVFHQSTQGLTIASNKQVLTIYNPFSYALDFRVLSTVPKFYTVSPSSGVLVSSSSIDVIIRLQDQTPHPSAKMGKNHKFKVILTNRKTGTSGTQIVPVVFSPPSHNSYQISNQHPNQHQHLNAPSNAGGGLRSRGPGEDRSSTHHRHGPNSTQTSSSSNSNISGNADSVRVKWRLLPVGARLLPTLLGVCLVYLLSAGEIDGLTNAEDGSLHPSSVWIAFFVGMITMVLQLRFLDFYT